LPGYWSPMDEVKVVVAHSERATLRVGDVFLKVDADQARIDVEVEAMALAPVPTPEVLWRKPPVPAIAAVPGTALGHLGEPSTASPAAGAAIRTLHDAPLPPRPGQAGRGLEELAADLDGECAWLVTNGVLPLLPTTCGAQTSRRRQMAAQPRVTNAWWMSSRISQRVRRRPNQCSSAIAP
jgi:hypothetical protein